MKISETQERQVILAKCKYCGEYAIKPYSSAMLMHHGSDDYEFWSYCFYCQTLNIESVTVDEAAAISNLGIPVEAWCI
jgi:hypothetical protein